MKVAVITGASRGIGRACAERLAEDGCSVVINHRNSEQQAFDVYKAITAKGGNAMVCRADVSDLKEVKSMMQTVIHTYGKIDILINNAGIVMDEYLLMMNDETLNRCMDINVKGYFYCAQQAALKMFRKKSGLIINMSSVSAQTAIAGQSVYSATKGAVNSMTRTMAKELAPYGIRVNAVAPGFIETEMIDNLPAEKREEYLNAIPLRRFGRPEDVANAVSMLCSSACTYMTGQTLVLDGGLSL